MDYNKFISLIIAILLFVFTTLLFRSLILLNRFKNIPGPGPRLPLIGSVLTFYRPGVSFHKLTNVVFTEMAHKFKKDGLAVLFLGSKVVVFLLKAEFAAEFFKDNSLIDKPSEYNVMKCLLGNGLATANGLTWKNKRRLLNPTFHSKILEEYIIAMNEESIKLTKMLHEASKKSFIDIRNLMNEIALNIIAKTAMGVTLEQNSVEFKMFSDCLHRIKYAMISRIYNPLNWYDFIFYRRSIGKQMKKDLEFIFNFTKNVIKERKNDFKPGVKAFSTKQMVFLDLMLILQSEDESITDEDMLDDVVTFLIVGHETSSTCLIWTLFLLGNNNECQQKLIKEFYDIFEDDKERNINKDDLQKMQYTECVIKESLRLYPPAPMFGRVANTVIEIGGYTIPKGTSVMTLALQVHKDEEVFSNPIDFIPERFENHEKIQIGFMPFASGPRNCIGQRFAMIEMKIILAHIFRNFTILSLDNESDIEVSIDASTTAVSPIRIAFNAIKL